MDILKTLNRVLNPKFIPIKKSEIPGYGLQELEVLLEAFSSLDGDRTQRDYTMFKFLLNNNREKSL